MADTKEAALDPRDLKIAALEKAHIQMQATIEKLQAPTDTKSAVGFTNPQTGIVTMPDRPFEVKGKKYEFLFPAFNLPNYGRVIAAEILDKPEILEVVLLYPDLYKAL
jgi:hypothetical protein